MQLTFSTWWGFQCLQSSSKDMAQNIIYSPEGGTQGSELCLMAAAAAKSLQSCPTLCDPTDGSSPGSPVHGIFQARVLEWGAIAFSCLMAKLVLFCLD